MSLTALLRLHGLALLAATLLSLAPATAQEAEQPQSDPPAEAPAEDPATEEPPAPDLPAILTDPSVDLEAFSLYLIPLTADELAALADEWLALAKAGTEELVAEEVRALSEDETTAAQARERVVALTESRNELFQRYSEVLEDWQKKGGDPATIDGYRAYRNAILVEEKRNADFRTLAKQSLDWATDRDGGVQLFLRASVIIGSFLGLLIVARVVRRFARRALERVPNLSKLMQSFLLLVIYWLTIALGLMIVLSALGVDITPLFALVGGASFIIAFAMQDTLGNLAAGLMIMINRPFDEGDYVDIGGVGGTVMSVSIVSTKVTTPDNQVIVIPNSNVWGNVITNVTASDTRRVDLVFGIGYEDSIEDAQRVLEEVVAAHPKILKDPEPVIRVNALGASSVDFICRPWARSADYWTVYWDLTRQVKERFDAEGISIPFPQTDMHIKLPEGAVGVAPVVATAAQSGTGTPDGAPDFATGDEGHET